MDLSPREHEVMAMVAVGLSNKEIGQRLNKSELTVKNQVAKILFKLGALNRTEAAAIYILRRCNIERPDWMPA